MTTAAKVGLGIVLTGAIGAIVVGGFMRGGEGLPFKWKVKRETPLPVQLAKVTRGKMVKTIEVPGKIEADAEVPIRSPVRGRIVKLPVQEGARVKTGELLAQLDGKGPADQDGKAAIRSTKNGIVARVLAKEGDTVNPADPVLEIIDLDRLTVRVRVDEMHILSVQPGQAARVRLQADDKNPLPGTVKAVNPRAIKVGIPNVLESNAFEATIRLASPPARVALGMTVSAEIQVDERDGVLTIPARAVLHRRVKDLPAELASRLEADGSKPGGTGRDKKYHQVVFVAVEGKVRCRLVRTGISDDRRVEVLSGVSEGEVVVSGPYQVFDSLQDGRAIQEASGGDESDE